MDKKPNGAPPAGNVIVACRVRPLNSKEKEKGGDCCVEFGNDNQTISINIADGSAFGTNKFNFDRVFNMKSE